MVRKCYFCEHDRGPLAYQMNACLTCRNFDNFQVKKRMSPRDMYEYEQLITDEILGICKNSDDERMK